MYVPPDPPEAIVFAGDGQGISQWGRYLEAADVPSTMIVGVHRLADEMPRLQEYSPGFDAERFAAHEKFFVEDVRRWVRSRFGVALPAERTAVFGVSAGGELALALGLRHPDVYGAVFSGSPGGGYRPPGVMPSSIPRVYLVAGTLEPFFLENATRWAAALHDAGADVVMTERVAIARRRAVASRVPADGGMGVWTMKHRGVVRRSRHACLCRSPMPASRARMTAGTCAPQPWTAVDHIEYGTLRLARPARPPVAVIDRLRPLANCTRTGLSDPAGHTGCGGPVRLGKIGHVNGLKLAGVKVGHKQGLPALLHRHFAVGIHRLASCRAVRADP